MSSKNSCPLGTENVTLFRNSVFKDTIGLKDIILD